MALKETVDELLRQGVESGAVPGVVAIATDANGNFYEGAFGSLSLSNGGTMALDSVFWIASLTKSITGVAAMMLVEQGKLDLDAPASDVLPELADVQVLDGFDDAGEPVLRPPKSPVTLRHLLTHTSGFGYAFWSADIDRYVKAVDIPPISSRTRAALRLPLLFDPGTDWIYGVGIDWAGLMVEQVSGQKLGRFMSQNLFEPLGMDSTAFGQTADMKGRVAAMHHRKGEGLTEPEPAPPAGAPEIEMGGGGLVSTMPDYARFARLILNRGRAGGHQYLKPETFEMMRVNQMGDNRVRMLKSTDRTMTNDAEFFPGIEKTWGLSFMINEQEAPTGRSAGSLAWAGMANSYFWADPDKGVAGAFSTQILPFADHRALPLYLQFEKAVYDSL
ncbi:serine hydrolase domain-containing protein [Minwuia sp.]|uniref:serine hydrolase domain-containing protein n=1 Tax=Minwuia sp. TaxID=2493630 RepID=UPI003A8CBE6A